MLKSLLIVTYLAVSAYAQSCDPTKVTGPCDLGCGTGYTCDTTLQECCLNADLVTATTATGVSTTTSRSGTSGTASTTSSGNRCVDRVNPATGKSDCTNRKSLCNDSTYYDVMTQQCPKTCGRCSSVTTSSGSCVDLKNPKTGTSDCQSMKSYCNNSNYIDLMKVQCPRTCGFCGSTVTSRTTSRITSATTRSSGTCVDRINNSTGISDCTARRSLCNNSAYQTLMRTQCPKTCGFC